MSDHTIIAVKHQSGTRYDSCFILGDNEVPYVVWFEDAVLLYGVPTVVFDLYILVPDLGVASRCLIKAGWALDTESPRRIGDAEVDIPQIPLLCPNGATKTVLLLASDWKVSLTASSPFDHVSLTLASMVDGVRITERLPDKTASFPTLPGLLDALIESWLDGPSNHNVLHHLAIMLNYLYAYALALKEASFADQLRYEHRQFHYDLLSGMDSSTLLFREHERKIREALLVGEYKLQRCSAPDSKDLFPSWEGVRLPDPPEGEFRSAD
ncbi:uncharacterized protein DSM5745_10897 [Aspergillus mulundensis]|uniref:Uncharacterized protein n=1 Tax=Aspergillus mulundensis TaxID=1810919 RepID=A0A3D8QF33_9EURO|nr:hypothetical protein DSM5745_10897 [Aspergillus mulundensis]RDW60439.1 hypothetical protein DSM5745_10897 [Aspergillus mulundensis]